MFEAHTSQNGAQGAVARDQYVFGLLPLHSLDFPHSRGRTHESTRRGCFWVVALVGALFGHSSVQRSTPTLRLAMCARSRGIARISQSPQRQCSLGISPNYRHVFSRSARRAVPIHLAECGNPFLAEESVLKPEMVDASMEGNPLDHSPGEFQAVLPEQEDLERLARLLVESFMKLWKPWLLPPSLGYVADLWNSWFLSVQRTLAVLNIKETIARRLKSPSVKLPRGFQIEGHSLGVMLVPTGSPDGPPAAFFELFLMPPDGRRPDDPEAQFWPLLRQERPRLFWEPYLSNLCVSPAYRRKGLGRATTALAERVVREVWGKEWLYLHADIDAVDFYWACGYETNEAFDPLAEPQSGTDRDIIYMRKSLKVLEDTSEDGVDSRGDDAFEDCDDVSSETTE